MRSNRQKDIIPIDLEIERMCRQNRKTKRRLEFTMADNLGNGANNDQGAAEVPREQGPRTLRDYMVQTAVQFGGLPIEDHNMHIANFLESCATFKMNRVSDDAIRLRLFPFSLRERAKSWLNSLEANTITTWDALAQKFLAKFFPPAKAAKLRGEINNFSQLEGESFYDAWERFKDLIRKFPHHSIEKWMLVHKFYNGLCGTTCTIIDAAAGGAFMRKSANEAYELLEEMATNNYQWPSERAGSNKKVVGVHELDTIIALTAQVASLTKQLQQVMCELCGGPLPFDQCQAALDPNNVPLDQAQVQAVGNFQRPYNNPYSNSYNPGWRNHPNFSLGEIIRTNNNSFNHSISSL
ncbi:uncharacterized protein LOC133791343 [Humulus lupulus]|uniref:uncharacterized protein LOC133791343 n=1 Tax=Humulus lupulus TaxID=3486 RepID=UPI002B4082B3|nr:uncharacterized protein LOC133791343 [Humulus lupulus]